MVRTGASVRTSAVVVVICRVVEVVVLRAVTVVDVEASRVTPPTVDVVVGVVVVVVVKTGSVMVVEIGGRVTGSVVVGGVRPSVVGGGGCVRPAVLFTVRVVVDAEVDASVVLNGASVRTSAVVVVRSLSVTVDVVVIRAVVERVVVTRVTASVEVVLSVAVVVCGASVTWVVVETGTAVVEVAAWVDDEVGCVVVVVVVVGVVVVSARVLRFLAKQVSQQKSSNVNPVTSTGPPATSLTKCEQFSDTCCSQLVTLSHPVMFGWPKTSATMSSGSSWQTGAALETQKLSQTLSLSASFKSSNGQESSSAQIPSSSTSFWRSEEHTSELQSHV